MADSNVGRLIYKITGDLSDIKSSLSNAEKQIGKFTKFVKSAAGLFGAAAAFRTLGNVTKELWDAALESEQVETKLSHAMKLTGQSAEGQTKQLTGLAKALSLVTTFTDEETVGAMTTLTEVGKVSARGMRELIPLVQDLAVGMGIDLSTAADQVSKVVSGASDRFGKLGPEIKKTNDPIERFNETVKALSGNFGGMAEAMAKASSGGLKQITNQFDELKEAAGNRLLQAFKGTISALSSRLKADVVLNMNVSEVGSPEEAAAFLKTLRVELDRVKASAKVARLEQAGLARSMTVSNSVVTDQDKRAADLANKIEALVRFMRNWTEVSADLSPVIINTAEAEKRAAEEFTKAEQERRDAISKSIDAEDARVQRYVEGKRKEKEEADKSAADKAAAEQKSSDMIKSIRDNALDQGVQILGAFNDINQASLNSQLAQLTAKQDAELANFQGTEEEKNALIAQFAKDRAKIEFDAAMRTWQLQLAAAIVGGARTIISGFETQPFIPAGLIAGSLATALTAAQIAAVIKAKPIPAFAEGANFTIPPGFPNDSFLMRGQSGEHVNITPAGGGGVAKETHHHFEVGGRELAHIIQRELDDGRILVSKGKLKR